MSDNSRFSFYAEYAGPPFWVRTDGEVVQLERPEIGDLPIPKALADQVLRWNVIYSEMLDWDDPGYPIDTPLERELHYLCGLSLAQRLANALGHDVYFFDGFYLAEGLKFSPGAC